MNDEVVGVEGGFSVSALREWFRNLSLSFRRHQRETENEEENAKIEPSENERSDRKTEGQSDRETEKEGKDEWKLGWTLSYSADRPMDWLIANEKGKERIKINVRMERDTDRQMMTQREIEGSENKEWTEKQDGQK